MSIKQNDGAQDNAQMPGLDPLKKSYTATALDRIHREEKLLWERINDVILNVNSIYFLDEAQFCLD